jgi:DNA-binding MarR family transcriptional regulator
MVTSETILVSDETMSIVKTTASEGQPVPDGGETLRLEEFLPYKLSILAKTVSDGLAARYSKEFGLSIPEARILTTCGQTPRMTANAICAHSGMNKVMVSRGIASLDARGFIKTVPNQDDRREIFLSLTAVGNRIYRKLVPLALRFEAELRGLVTDERFDAFNAGLDLFLARIDTR